jgi:hypothetical protein
MRGIFSIATFFPESCARTDVANISVSCGLACACTRKMQCRGFAAQTAFWAGNAKNMQIASAQRFFMPIDKEFDRICNVCCLTRS